MILDVDDLENICPWCEDSGILKFDYDEKRTIGDECPVCKDDSGKGLTLEEFEDQLREEGYTEEEIRIELEKIETENENLGD